MIIGIAAESGGDGGACHIDSLMKFTTAVGFVWVEIRHVSPMVQVGLDICLVSGSRKDRRTGDGSRQNDCAGDCGVNAGDRYR